jgi:predicted tellurium resistance membrane protein TerC
MGGHVGKGYIYFAMFFSLSVELINMRYRSRRSLEKEEAPHAHG